MPRRLQEIVSKLYRPPVGVRQVFALSRDDAERLPRLASIAVISITAPERPAAQLDGINHVLRLSFADVDFLRPKLSAKAKAKLDSAFTVEQAQAVRQFVDCLPADIASVVVHCEGGFSRSCAIALGLHHLYGYQVETEQLTQANPSVLRVLTGKHNSGIHAYHSTTKMPDRLLTIAEAAAQLDVSRPYVSMLCDAGKLGEIDMENQDSSTVAIFRALSMEDDDLSQILNFVGDFVAFF
ncbi:hypothetical protein [Cupriavidus sp. TMH.W2]|uniref:hypothetical protein n=1 Tax=Cupriavidus sp. TMH.W2 TaxID=3434465 RepID=UPI003D7890B0